MARKPNYNYEKRQKEIARKQKQEEKRARKREEKDGSEGDPGVTDESALDTPPAQ